MTAARRFLRLPVRAQALLVIAVGLQMAARVLLRVTTVPRLDRAALALGGHLRLRPDDAPLVVWAIAASSPRAGGTCLTQALAARALLAASGCESRLILGVRPALPRPEFHAWTESPVATIPPKQSGHSPSREYERLLVCAAPATVDRG
jgi:hypothetical protein